MQAEMTKMTIVNLYCMLKFDVKYAFILFAIVTKVLWLTDISVLSKSFQVIPLCLFVN